MNLYVYLQTRNDWKIPAVSGLEKLENKAVCSIRESGLSLTRQQQALDDFQAQMNQDIPRKKKEKSAQEWIGKYSGKSAQKFFRNEMDFLLIAPLWIGLYHGLWIGLAENKAGLQTGIPFGWGLILETLCVIVCIKGIMLAMTRKEQGWKRWLLWAALFVFYFLGLYLSRKAENGLKVELWLLVVVCAGVFACGVWLHLRIYEPEKLYVLLKKQEKRTDDF